MSGKFMTVKKYVIPTLTMLLIASQLTGCSSATSKEALQMLERGDSITIEVAEPISIEQGTEITYEWKELAYLDNYEDFRFIFDDILAITNHGSNGKNGVIYADLEGNHTDNSTLYYAFMNRAFVEKYWNNTDVAKTIANAAEDIYTDLSNQHESLLAGYNAYYNLIPDSEPGFANMQSTMTRLEALSFLYKCDTPVQELETDTTFLAKVGDNVHTIFAQQIADQSYLKADNDSLDATTANGTITRAEFIYTLVQRYYSDEYNQVTGKETCYSDAKNGGDIALKQKYTTKDKETGNLITPNKWQSYELSYSLQNPDKGMPDDLYKALVVAYNHNLIDSDESNWELGLTKYDAMKFVTTVYEDLTSNDKFIMNVDRGESIGTVVENSVEYVDTTDTVEANNGQLESTERAEEYAEGTYYVKVNDDGTKEYSPELLTGAMQVDALKGLTYDEVIKVLDSVLDNPKLYGNDEYLRFSVSAVSKNTVNLILDKASNTSSSSSTGTSSSSTGSSTSQQTQQQPAQPQQQVTPAPSTPSSPVNEYGLTQEEMDAIRAENEAAGWGLSVAPEGHHTGEDTSDFQKYN